MLQNAEKKIPIVIGVSGHRRLRAGDLPALRASVREKLSALQADFPHSPLVMLCSLAEGADLLCADASEELGIPLLAALPLPLEEYEKDFSPEGVRCLEKHCARAEQVFVTPRSEEMPAQGDFRNHAYRQAGIYVSSHCHILLALWDGRPGEYGCGTAEAVGFALEGVCGPENGLPVRHAGNTLVWHVITPRGEDESAAAGEVRVLGDRQAVQEILKYTEEFNRLAEKTPQAEQELLPDPDPGDPILGRMLAVYGAASTLTGKNARQYRLTLAALAVASALIAMAFLLYDEAEAIGLILVIGLLLLLSWLLQRLAGRSACLRRYIEYRVLAECLRVGIYLRHAGSGIRVENLLSWTQQTETAWVLDALCALRAGCPPEREHEIRTCWVEQQRAYHRAGEEKTRREDRFSSRVVGAALRLSVLLYLLALLFELFCGGVLTTPLLPAENAEGWRTLLKIALGSISAMTLFVANYYGRLSLPRVLSDHGKMERFFARMSEKLLDEGQTDALLTTLAREELIENGNWCSYQRDNTPEISLS